MEHNRLRRTDPNRRRPFVAGRGSGFLDVTIRGDGSDSINLFSFSVEIQPLGAALGQLAFTDPQPDLQLGDADYIFFGDSIKQIGRLPLGNVSQGLTPNDTFSGEDLTFSGSDVLVSATERLFLRFEVTAATPFPPLAGDQFSIALSDLLFLNSDGMPLPFESRSGIVTVAVPTAVPEPASMSLLCPGALGLAARPGAARRRLQA